MLEGQRLDAAGCSSCVGARLIPGLVMVPTYPAQLQSFVLWLQWTGAPGGKSTNWIRMDEGTPGQIDRFVVLMFAVVLCISVPVTKD